MKVLTIDFDIIMAPSILMYNHLSDLSWKVLIESSPQFALLQPDYIHYSRLTEYFWGLLELNSRDSLIFIENHGRIPHYLEGENKIDLINIDHHHDIRYHDDDDIFSLNCGNWVGYLIDNGRLNSYHWINNENSLDCNIETYKDFYTQETLKNSTLIPDKYDKIFICLSEPWVPPYIRPLFDLWVRAAENYYLREYKLDCIVQE